MTRSLNRELHPRSYTPGFEGAGLSLQHRVTAQLDCGEPSGRHGLNVQDSTIAVDQSDIDREPHAHRVHVPTGAQPDRPDDAVATQQTLAPRLIGVSHLDVADATTGHHENPHTAILGPTLQVPKWVFGPKHLSIRASYVRRAPQH